MEAAVKAMTTLNRQAAELIAHTANVHACTDVTGFGLLGHACEMIAGEDVGMVIHASAVPFFRGIRDLVETGLLPEGLYRNRNFCTPQVTINPNCPEWLVDILFDPQTAGGLLIALAAEEADGLLLEMQRAGLADARIIGEVTHSEKGKILIT
jgi:selenide,water dikinase